MDQVPVKDMGFRWGRGVFETLVVRDGRGEWQDWHREAMVEAARELGLDPQLLPASISAPGELGLWRWFLTPSGFYTDWEPGLPDLPSSMSLSLSPHRLSSRSWDARFKTLSYLTRFQARHEAFTDEVVLLNEHGEVASASMANLFLVIDDELLTPPLESGCRAGVIRRWVIECSGQTVRETKILPARLESADAIFLTNSRIGICPVVQFDATAFSSHPLVEKLKSHFNGFNTTSPK
jgi:4-amino-4-deoxychorismate lyase